MLLNASMLMHRSTHMWKGGYLKQKMKKKNMLHYIGYACNITDYEFITYGIKHCVKILLKLHSIAEIFPKN